MQECCFHSPLLSGTVLSFHSFFLFFPLFSPKWGSPLMPQRGVGLPVSFAPPLPLSPASLVYIPLPLFGDLKVPPPLCGVQTLSPPLQRKKAGPTHWNSLVLTLTSVCWLKAMSSRGGLAWASARTIFLAAALKVKDFFVLKQIRCRDCGGRNETRLTGQGGLFSLKKGGVGGGHLACMHLA